ncbi:TRAP transporter small permease subunit [Mesorhizobium sp. A556]
MPSLTFVLPHWLYWAGLVIFPALAMILARRSSITGTRPFSLPLGYFILVTGGMLGLHRLYLRSKLGFVFILAFLFILVANAQQRDARVALSNAANQVSTAQSALERETGRLAGSAERIAQLQTQFEEAEEGSIAQRLAERKIESARSKDERSRERISQAEQTFERAKPVADAARTSFVTWRSRAFYAFIVILAAMAIDAILLPRLVATANRRKPAETIGEPPLVGPNSTIPTEDEILGRQPDKAYLTRGWTGAIDRLSMLTGEFVSYWAVIAVFVYYYEVMARYVFNSPTIWAHESMFLMFGMQYLICGAYAMLTENHVRVDIFYATWSARRKAIIDLLTSIFFFIFAGVLLVTSWIFAMDATRVSEVSFTEWRIAYWPMKWAMVVGAILLSLQGISKFTQDIRAIAQARET